MRRVGLFIGILLVSSLLIGTVFAQFNKSLLSGRISPVTSGGGTGVACLQGPNYTGNGNNVPGPALAAGFTSCLLNADFTTSTTDANGINYSNTATFIAQCGAPTRTLNFYLLYDFGPNGGDGGGFAPCARATIINDTTGGAPQVLDLTLTLADQTAWVANHANAGRWVALTWPIYFLSSTSGLPFEYYTETTLRVPSDSIVVTSGSRTLPFENWMVNSTTFSDNSSFAPNNFESSSTCNTAPCTTLLAGDGNAYLVNGSLVQDSILVSGTPGGDGNSAVTLTNTDQYHTLGVLITSDETSVVMMCWYWDGLPSNPTQIGCNKVNPPAGTGAYASHAEAQFNQVGDAECFGVNLGCLVNPAHNYIKAIRIFACPSWATLTCPGPVIHGEIDSPVRYAWGVLKKAAGKLVNLLIPPAMADDPFDYHFNGYWYCPDGSLPRWAFAACMPDNLKGLGTPFWEKCAAGRSDCVWSPTAFLGKEGNKPYGKAIRGPGYCYTEQPFTCAPDGKWPPSG